MLLYNWCEAQAEFIPTPEQTVELAVFNKISFHFACHRG
jgi:hypothetical protein